MKLNESAWEDPNEIARRCQRLSRVFDDFATKIKDGFKLNPDEKKRLKENGLEMRIFFEELLNRKSYATSSAMSAQITRARNGYLRMQALGFFQDKQSAHATRTIEFVQEELGFEHILEQ